MEISKRFFFLLVAFLIVLPVQTADWASQRHLYSGNLFTSLPDDKKMYSPLVGLIGLEGEWGKAIYSEGEGDTPTDRGRLAHLLFNCLDSRLRKTARPSNPFYSITPKLFGAFVKAQIENIDVEDFLASDIGEEWRALHKEKGLKFKGFKKKIREFVALLNKIPSKERDHILAMFAMAMSENSQNLSDYIKGLTSLEIVPQKTNLLDEQLSFDNADSEQVVSLLINSQLNYYQKLIPRQQLYADYNNHKVAICVEQALWGFINMLLYNPIKKELDISLLPPGININFELKAFIEKYKRFNNFNYYDNAKNEFMNLVSGIKGIKYCHDGYELESNAKNSLDMLNYLFGLKTDTFESFGEHLSSDVRKIDLKLISEPVLDDLVGVDIKDNMRSFVEVGIKDSSQDYEIHAEWVFDSMHSKIRFKKDSSEIEKIKPYLKKMIDFSNNNPYFSLTAFLVPVVNEALKMDDTEFNSLGFESKERFLSQVLESSSFKTGNIDVPAKVLSALSSKVLQSLIINNDDCTDLVSEVISRDDLNLLQALASKCPASEILEEAVIQDKQDIVLQLLLYNVYPSASSIRKVVKKNDLNMLMLFLDFNKIRSMRKKLGLKGMGRLQEKLIKDVVRITLDENQEILKELIKNKSLGIMRVIKSLDVEKDKEMAQFIFDYLQSSDLEEEGKEIILQNFPNINQV